LLENYSFYLHNDPNNRNRKEILDLLTGKEESKKQVAKSVYESLDIDIEKTGETFN